MGCTQLRGVARESSAACEFRPRAWFFRAAGVVEHLQRPEFRGSRDHCDEAFGGTSPTWKRTLASQAEEHWFGEATPALRLDFTEPDLAQGCSGCQLLRLVGQAVPLGAAGAPGSECRGGQRLQRQWPGLSTCTRCLMGRCLGTDDQVHHGLLRRSLR
ncbi:unnamed protein product [Cladocopium goreaui]|uniref:Uncharacterized protein n=1 Tax=Cladocopium goreaui TaxID=2562237 RepID=A0A9P1GBC3_9DINO|nr:unnamed protein product [Cladocopium goreaui]